MEIETKLVLGLEIPATPNFIRASNSQRVYKLNELQEDVIREIGRVWTEELVHKSKRKD